LGVLRKAARDLFLGSTHRLHIQFFRYAVAGGVATVADFTVYALLVKVLGIHYLIGNACAFSAGIGVNYLASIWWVFASRSIRSKRAEVTIFALIGIIGLGISQLSMYVGVDVVGIYDLLAKVGATVCTLIWNFSARKWLLFRRQSGEE